MAFAALDEKVGALLNALERAEWADQYDEHYDLEADFNSCLVALAGDFYREREDGIWGFDCGESDYFDLDNYDAEYAVTEAGKRLCRKTKAKFDKQCNNTPVRL